MQPMSTRLAYVLSDQDVASITQKVDRDALTDHMNGDWLAHFARAIESAVLTKLAKQAPVATAWMQHGVVVEVFGTPPTKESEHCTNDDAHWTGRGFVQTPLYATPQPIKQKQALRVALEEMDYANKLALDSLGVAIINPKTIAALKAALE